MSDRNPGKTLAREAAVAAAVDAFANYIVVRNGSLVASFALDDDALMFMGELAELDQMRGREAQCTVVDRRGRNIGGYALKEGKELSSYCMS